jgi:copper chaperone
MEVTMRTISYSVPDVSCSHCRAAIAAAVSAVSGVDTVEVDLDTKIVTVGGDPLDTAAIAAAIDAAGYEVAA